MSDNLVPSNEEAVLIPQITVIRIVNPFDPRDHVRESLDWSAGKTLADYFPIGTVDSIVSINGKIIADEDFPVTYLAPQDNLVVCPVPRGGGGGKSILRLVAMIAMTYFTAGLGGAMLGIEGAAMVGGLGVTMANVAVTMAGAMLVNALLPPSKSSSGNNSEKSTSSYGVDGAKNTSIEGVVVPVLYGEFRTAGNVINLFMENDGDTQLLYMRMVVSEGEILSIADIEINDQPVADYTVSGVPLGIESDIRKGTSDQTCMGWFADTVRPISVGKKLDTNWTVQTLGNIDKFRIDLSAASGLFKVNDDGSLSPIAVPVEIQYRPTGGITWAGISAEASSLGTRLAVLQGSWVWGEENGFGADATFAWAPAYSAITDAATLAYIRQNSANVPVWADGNDGGGGYVDQLSCRIPIYGSSTSLSDKKRSAVRRSFTSGQLFRGTYDVRVRRSTAHSTDSTVSDEVYWSDANEILLEDTAFPSTAMLGVKIKLSNQIGNVPKVTALVRGRLLQVRRLAPAGAGYVWYTEYSNNPAWVTWDILTNERYGGAVNVNRLDLTAFQEFADHCTDKGLTWNGPIDNETNVWDACQMVLRVGHAQLVGVGTRFSVVIEKAALPMMMFSVANMIEGTFKENWLPITDRANEIEVTYFDRLDKYKQRTVKVYDPAVLAAGRPQRSSAITMYGIVDHDRAFKEGLFQLNLNRLILQTVEFSAPLEAIACSVGDLIYVQHDMPQWGFAGRLEAGCTTSVMKLDRDVQMTFGKQYMLLVVHDALMRCSGSVTSVVGTSVFLTGYDGGAPVKRIRFGAIEREVAGVFNQGGGAYGVVLHDSLGVAPGASYELWDTDVLEERNVVNGGGTGTILTLQSPLSFAPGQFVHWMFGEVGKYKKPFRVKAISGTHEYRRDITAIEYNESAYDLDSTPVPAPNYSSLTSEVLPVTIDSIDESLFVSATGFRTHVTVHFSSSQETFSRASVYASTDGWFQLIDANAHNRATIDLSDGDVVTFRIVPRDVLGFAAAESNVTYVTHTVLGKAFPPSNVTGFAAGSSSSGIVLAWSRPADIDYSSTIIKVGTSWNSGETLFEGAVTRWTWVRPANGTYTFWAKHVDTTGHLSQLASTLTFTFDIARPIVPLGDFAAPPPTAGLQQNNSYRNTSDGNTYILSADGGSWSVFMAAEQLIINPAGNDIDVELRFNRTAGGAASITWNGQMMQASKPFQPVELGINNISATPPSNPFPNQVWIDVS